jgi:hypothetical protein
MYCDAVYSFILEDEHVMIINGVECVTLGHHFEGEVVAHPYFGSSRVISDLSQMEGWSVGLVSLHSSNCLIRDQETSLICGLQQ